MNAPAIIFTILAGLFLFRLDRHWAALPLLMGATYMAIGQNVALGPFHFTVIRILVAIGVARVALRGERITGGINTLDRLTIFWALWCVLSSFFHKDFSQALVYRLGLAYDALGLYFLFRVFIPDTASVVGISKMVVIALVPVALEMMTETATGRNSFSLLGGVGPLTEIRGGKIRAQGPFAHSILAGTVGAVCLPMALLFWQRNRKVALLGVMATGSMVLCSRSSGPIMTAFFAVAGVCLWKFRKYMRLLRWTVLLGLIGLNLVMNAPVYYLLNRINLTGKSDSFHRAVLIDSAIHHFDEWWVGGTDYTRNWTADGGWTESDTDITNYYIKMGVLGGLPMMLLFISMLVAAFRMIGKALPAGETASDGEGFVYWTLGSTLFGHASAMISVSYFDQSVVFLYLALAAIGSIQRRPQTEPLQYHEEETMVLVSDERDFCNHS